MHVITNVIQITITCYLVCYLTLSSPSISGQDRSITVTEVCICAWSTDCQGGFLKVVNQWQSPDTGDGIDLKLVLSNLIRTPRHL